MTEYTGPMCALCAVQACSAEPGVKQPPAFCPMPVETELLDQVAQLYRDSDEVRRLAQESARTEAAGYGRTTRIEDIMDFARRIGAHKLGIAHCVGLLREARLAQDILVAGGFEVYTVCCKVGSIAKESIGLADEDKIRPGQY